MSTPVKLRQRIVPAIAAMAGVGLLAMTAWHGYRAALSQPLERVIFAGEVDRLPPAELEALSRTVVSAGAAGLAEIRDAARRVPWVREATVRRQFPDAVEVTFEVHQALARWNERQLVSPRGEVFTAAAPAALPRFRGPEGAAGAMTAEYPAIVAALAPLGSPVKELHLSARGAWGVVLESGLAVELGRDDWKARTHRFAAAWPRLAEDARAARYADLRYPNGFALRATLTPALSPSPRPSPTPRSTPWAPEAEGERRGSTTQ